MRGLTDILGEAIERFHPQLTLACSFQKEETVLIDALMEVEPSARVFTIDTGVLFPETYETWKKIEDRYGLKIEVYDASSSGNPWTGGDHCCSQTGAKVQELQGMVDQLKQKALPQLASQNKVIDDLMAQVKAKTTQALPGAAGKPLDSLKNIFGK